MPVSVKLHLIHEWTYHFLGLLKIKNIGLKLFRAKDALVILGWGVSLANLAVTAIAYGVLVPQAQYYSEATPTQMEPILFALYYAGFFGICFLTGLVLRSISTALLGFFCSYAIGILIASLILDLPELAGVLPQAVAANLATGIIFIAFFPFGLLVGLVGALLGSALVDT